MGAHARLAGRQRAAQLPPALRHALEELFGESVGQVRVIEHAWLARLHLRALATTRPGRIYLRADAAAFFANPWLVLHEYWHVLRQWQPGELTVPRYLAECLRRGYWNNRFEVEARAFADAHAPALHARLAGAGQPSSASRR